MNDDEDVQHVRGRLLSLEEEIAACLKFLQTEEHYMSDLKKGRDIFLKRLRVHIDVGKTVITLDQINSLFANYETLCSAHVDLFKMMMDLRIKSPRELHAKLGQLICEFVPYFKMYIPYVANQDRRKDTLKTVNAGSMLGGSGWKTFLLINERIAENSLKHFLEAPENRLVHYIEDLSTLAESFADTSRPSARSVFFALQELNVILKQITEKVKDLKNRRDLANVKAKLFASKNITLSTATRFVVKKGSCKIVYKEKLVKVRVVLCSDMIFVQKPAKSWGRGGGLAFALAMKGMDMNQGAEGNEIENSFHPKCRLGLQNKIADTPTYIINFHDETQCIKWMEEIEKRVEAEELTERPCNPIGLMKRLRNEKTTGEEAQEYMHVTDELQLQKIRSYQKNSDKQRQSRMDLLTGFTKTRSSPPLARINSAGGATMPSDRVVKRAVTTNSIPKITEADLRGEAPPFPHTSSKGDPATPKRVVQRSKTQEIPKVTQADTTTTTLNDVGGPSKPSPKRKSKPMGLLAGIKLGAKLKKAAPIQKKPTKKSFLDDLRGGTAKKKLRAASKRKIEPILQKADNSILDQVKATLANYRNIVVASDDEDESDSGWD